MAAEAPPRTHLKHDGFLGIFGVDAEQGWQAVHFTVKRTFRLEPGTLMVPTAWQQACFVADRCFDDSPPHLAPVQYEGDIGPPKPVCDVVVEALCHPPGGKATRCDVAVEVGGHDKVEFTVVGDRTALVDPGDGVRFTPASQFDVRPIRYEWAYGGADPASDFIYQRNPVGTGYVLKSGAGRDPQWRTVVLPNIEHAGRLMTPDTFLTDPVEAADVKATPDRTPAGFGWVSRFWSPRIEQGGVPAEAGGLWSMMFPGKDEVAGVARTRRARYHNGAIAPLQLPLEGHELITFTHLHPEHPRLIVQLPIMNPRLRAAVGDDAPQPVRMTLATVHVQLERDTATLCWRGTLMRPDAEAEPGEAPAVKMKVDGVRLPPPETVCDGLFDPANPPAVEVGAPS